MTDTTDRSATPQEADLVVLGAGGAGLPAALQAVECGVRRVVLVDNRKSAGGNAVFASGIYACESPIHRRDMIDVNSDDVYQKVMDWHHHAHVNGRLLRAYIKRSGDTIRWLIQKGIEFEVGPAMMMYYGQLPTWHMAMNKRTGDISRFAQVIRLLEKELDAGGAKFLFESKCTSILKDANGRVSGVEIEGADGQSITIKTRAVVVATGGFIGNKELLHKYFPDFDEKFGGFYLPMKGDGIDLVAKAGGALEHYAGLVKEAPGSSDEMSERSLTIACREPYTVWVNRLGRRFSDETVGFHLQTCTNVIVQQPQKMAFALYDDAMIQSVIEQGWQLPRFPSMGTDVKFRDQLLVAAPKREWAMSSDSWGPIADWLGASRATLEQTVATYNEACEHGYDQEFAKDRRFLRKLIKPPFYAIRFGVMIIETCGPVRVDERLQVLDTNHHPVAGLYAAGAIAAGWMGHDYCGDHLFGTALGFAMNSGRIAGEQVAAFLNGST